MAINLKSPTYYINRELSWLTFNDRVLEEAADNNHPLLERLKFLAIFSSNLDEFYMIRVAGIKEQIFAGIQDVKADGLTPEEVDREISLHTHVAVGRQGDILINDVMPKLRRKGIRLRTFPGIRNDQLLFIEKYFREKIFPVLTPLGIDQAHPFPNLNSLGINLLVELENPKIKDEDKKFAKAVVPIPPSLARFIQLPTSNGKSDFITIEEVVKRYIGQLFPNMVIHGTSAFRITRNADLDLSEAEADDLLKHIERELRKRRLGTIVRMEVASNMSLEVREYLKKMTELQERDVYDIPCCLDYSAFFYFLGVNRPDLKDKPFSPALNAGILQEGSIFDAIKKHDIILHHPYESFNHVADFITEAAKDPDVLAIKQTLYRTSGDSPIVKALKIAVNNGKQVTALIELKARFDEANNIEWARELDQAGVNVVYGVLGLKTHCKILMVVRKEEAGIKRYLHLSTGNYNAKTAKIYTDIGLMTCNEEMGEDASGLFNLLTGYSLQKKWKKFVVAPTGLRKELLKQINNCIKYHTPEEKSYIKIVVNSIVDPEIILHLYKASMAGVKIDLVVRGICCIRPGIPGVSEKIHVRSIVGRFLEHCRIYYFKYQGESQIFMGSADLMGRNLDRRVELVFPVEKKEIKRRVRFIIQLLLDDNTKARSMDAEGNYHRVEKKPNAVEVDAQSYFLRLAQDMHLAVDTIPIG